MWTGALPCISIIREGCLGDVLSPGGPYDLILEGIGGKLLGSALTWLAPRGMCVQFGDAAGDELTVLPPVGGG